MPKTTKKTDTPREALARAESALGAEQKAVADIDAKLAALDAEESRIIAGEKSVDRLEAIVGERETLTRERELAEKRVNARQSVVDARRRDVDARRVREAEKANGDALRGREKVLAKVRQALRAIEDLFPELDRLETEAASQRQSARRLAADLGVDRPDVQRAHILTATSTERAALNDFFSRYGSRVHG